MPADENTSVGAVASSTKATSSTGAGPRMAARNQHWDLADDSFSLHVGCISKTDHQGVNF